MANILHIETSGQICSVAVSSGKEVVAKRTDFKKYRHSQKLTVYISEVVEEAGIDFSGLQAIAVSKGPGSYTGLRIGVSAAKGLAYALDIPLISVHTLQVMAAALPQQLKHDENLLCPMMDARRMEVYHALLNSKLELVSPVEATIIDEDFLLRLPDMHIVFFGDGMPKARHILEQHKKSIFADEVVPLAEFMVGLVYEKFLNKEFEDVAYFEPFYLKDFVSGDSSDKLKRVLNKE